MKKPVSIILNLYDLTINLRRMSAACITAIKQYTDPKDFELIIVDNKPRFKSDIDQRDRTIIWEHLYHHLKFIGGCEEKIIVNEIDPGHYASMNQGVKIAEGDYLVFTENDIFVNENWLNDLRYYLDHDLSVAIVPDQTPHTFEFRQDMNKKNHKETFARGMIDQSMMMIKKDIFEKVGGWDERFFRVFGWKAFEKRMGKYGYSINSTLKVPIDHIGQGTLDIIALSNDSIDYWGEESKLINDPNFEA